MATDTLQAEPIAATDALWQEALARLATADANYRRWDMAVFTPAFEREQAFLAEHGLGGKVPADPRIVEMHEADNFEHKVPGQLHDTLDALCDEFCEAQTNLMKLPAPHLPALRWKLDHILQVEHAHDGDGGSLSAWSGEYVRQMLADITRLLPAAA